MKKLMKLEIIVEMLSRKKHVLSWSIRDHILKLDVTLCEGNNWCSENYVNG